MTQSEIDLQARMSLLEFMTESLLAASLLSAPDPAATLERLAAENAALLDQAYGAATDNADLAAVIAELRRRHARFWDNARRRLRALGG